MKRKLGNTIVALSGLLFETVHSSHEHKDEDHGDEDSNNCVGVSLRGIVRVCAFAWQTMVMDLYFFCKPLLIVQYYLLIKIQAFVHGQCGVSADSEGRFCINGGLCGNGHGLVFDGEFMFMAAVYMNFYWQVAAAEVLGCLL